MAEGEAGAVGGAGGEVEVGEQARRGLMAADGLEEVLAPGQASEGVAPVDPGGRESPEQGLVSLGVRFTQPDRFLEMAGRLGPMRGGVSEETGQAEVGPEIGGAPRPMVGFQAGVLEMGEGLRVGRRRGVEPEVEPLDVSPGCLDGGGVLRPSRISGITLFAEPLLQPVDPLAGGEKGRRVAVHHLALRRTKLGVEPIPFFRAIPIHGAI